MAKRLVPKEGASDRVPKGQQGKTGKKEKKKKEEQDPFADESPLGLLKREAADKLGLAEKVRALGWGGLTAAESGRLGALVSRMLKERSGNAG